MACLGAVQPRPRVRVPHAFSSTADRVVYGTRQRLAAVHVRAGRWGVLGLNERPDAGLHVSAWRGGGTGALRRRRQ
ncbi:hypothetical protein ACP70R_030114 [Stipagrostis hirtigluma subsp. patula]